MDETMDDFLKYANVNDDLKILVEMSRSKGFDKVELNKMQKRISEGTQLILDAYSGGITKTGTKIVSKSTSKGK